MHEGHSLSTNCILFFIIAVINVVYVPVAIEISISASYWQDKLVGVILSHQRVGSAIYQVLF